MYKEENLMKKSVIQKKVLSVLVICLVVGFSFTGFGKSMESTESDMTSAKDTTTFESNQAVNTTASGKSIFLASGSSSFLGDLTFYESTTGDGNKFIPGEIVTLSTSCKAGDQNWELYSSFSDNLIEGDEGSQKISFEVPNEDIEVSKDLVKVTCGERTKYLYVSVNEAEIYLTAEIEDSEIEVGESTTLKMTFKIYEQDSSSTTGNDMNINQLEMTNVYVEIGEYGEDDDEGLTIGEAVWGEGSVALMALTSTKKTDFTSYDAFQPSADTTVKDTSATMTTSTGGKKITPSERHTFEPKMTVNTDSSNNGGDDSVYYTGEFEITGDEVGSYTLHAVVMTSSTNVRVVTLNLDVVDSTENTEESTDETTETTSDDTNSDTETTNETDEDTEVSDDTTETTATTEEDISDEEEADSVENNTEELDDQDSSYVTTDDTDSDVVVSEKSDKDDSAVSVDIAADTTIEGADENTANESESPEVVVVDGFGMQGGGGCSLTIASSNSNQKSYFYFMMTMVIFALASYRFKLAKVNKK